MRRRLIVSVLVVLVLVLTSVPVASFSGFHDDPGNTCLGDSDPFCSSGSGGGSGPSGCYACSYNEDTHEFSCINGTWGTSCTAINGETARCTVSGTC